MKGKIKITQSVIDRIKYCKYDHCGALYGALNKNSQYILGIFNSDDYSYADLLFPTEIDLCGAYQIGPINKDEVNQILKDVDVTDNPIFLSAPEPNKISAYYVINNKLENAQVTVLQDNEIYSEFIHVRLEAPISLVCEVSVDSINEGLLEVRKQISSGKLAFHCEKHDLYLLGSNENMIVGPENVTEETTIHKLYAQASRRQEEDDYSRNKNHYEMEILPVTMLKKATLDKNDNISTNSHAPFIQIEQNEVKLLNIVFEIDSVALVHRDTTLNKLYTTLVESACRNLKLIGNYIMETLTENDNHLPDKFKPTILHFYPYKCGHFVTRILNKNATDEENIRNMLHTNFLLPKSRPMFRPGNAYHFKKALNSNTSSKLRNPHKYLKDTTGGGEQALVQGDYDYYHYKQDGMDDEGWGCAYRSLQTLASWLLLQGYTDKEVPTYKDIQKCLYDIGDKPASFVGSKQWIGSTEVNFVLESLLGITCKIIFVSSGEELASKGPDLMYHFENYGSPIMIGGGVLAHTILGVDYNQETGDIKFLILDPHYTGKEDLKTILSKGFCGWKGMNFWDKSAYYNMCLPLVPKCI